MSDLIIGDSVTTQITQQEGHSWGASCYALPGSNYSALYMGVDWTVTASVDDSGDVLLNFTGDIRGTHVYGYSFPSKFYVSPNYFELTSVSGGVEISEGDAYTNEDNWPDFTIGKSTSPSNIYVNFAGTDSDSASSWIDPVFEDGLTINAGNIENFYWNNDDPSDLTGTIYVACIAYYDNITDPVTVPAIEIPLPNLKLLLEYFPGEIIRTENDWSSAVSCNRKFGYFKRRKNSKWIERKNKPADYENSHVFIYGDAGKDYVAPRIGKI